MTDQTAQNIQTTIDDNPVVLFMKGIQKNASMWFLFSGGKCAILS